MKRVASPSPSPPPIVQSASSRSRKLKVTIKSYHTVSKWVWGCRDPVCGICQCPFEGCAPGVNYPGDECPVVWGKCRHSFHLQCISTWIQNGKSTCPICRSEWQFQEEEGLEH